jgi:DNA-binding SARP family transcriptional activator/Tfp pilus assembly protein PilF
MTRFMILGPVRIVAADGAGDQPVSLPPKERTVLAALLLRAGEVVSVDSLARALWEDSPPSGARNAIQTHIKQLRRLLGTDAGRIVTRAPGYLIELEPGQLDLHVFIEHRARAATAATSGEWARSAQLLAEALELWQGEPLSNVSSALRRTEAPRLAEVRLEALEARIDADLRLGRHDALAAELHGLAAAQPFRERLWEQLMLALYRGGRQGEALAAYRRARDELRSELGIDPGASLQRLHMRMLSADRTLALPTDSAPLPRPAGIPRQLPADLDDFTGRTAETGLLRDLLTSGRRPGAIAIAAITGPGGIGKTALAVHLGHQVASAFPDGQLFIRLGGTTGHQAAFDILARMLRDLGVPDKDIPVGDDERAARYRTVMAERTMLLVLDDAQSSAQVRPLLPGSGGSAVLVTSRASLADLAGARITPLGAFDRAHSHALFVAIAGTARVAGDPASTESILAACGGLPLAVRIAASRLASQPSWSVSQLDALLTREQRRLAELAVGDTAVRASFEVSYLALPVTAPAPARVFRLYGGAGLRTLTLQALAALAGAPVTATAQAVTTLLGVHLLESPEPGRYQAHDLLRLYAAERAGSEEPDGSRRAAMHRLLTWYLHTLTTSIQSLRDIYSIIPLEPLAPGAPAPIGTSRAEALRWLDAERANLMKVVTVAAEHGMHEISCQLAAVMRYYFDWFGGFSDSLAVSATGLRSAQTARNEAATAALLNAKGTAHWKLGDPDAAAECYLRARAIRRGLGDKLGEVSILTNLGLVELEAGKVTAAIGRFTAALAVARELGARDSEGYSLHNLGYAFATAGRPDEALAHYQQALTLRAGHSPLNNEAATLHSIGALLITTNRVEEGMDYVRAALKLCEDNNLGYGEGLTLASLGDGYHAQGKLTEALHAWQQAYDILTALGATEAAAVGHHASMNSNLSLTERSLAKANSRAESPWCPSG